MIKSLRHALTIWTRPDFLLFGGTFFISLFTLNPNQSIPKQIGIIVVLTIAAVLISGVLKIWRNWSWPGTNLKGILSALGVSIFGIYAISSFALVHASRQGIVENSTSYDQLQAALSDPSVFASVAPFVFLILFAVFNYLGLADIGQNEVDA